MSERIAFYPGSFDPITNGHLDMLSAALNVADRVVVGIGVHPGKTPLFSFEERELMIVTAARERDREAASRIAVVAFKALVVDAAAQVGACMLIRGLRDGTDLDYEMQMAGMNAALRPEISTVFLPASPSARHITATLVRQIASMGGNVRGFVPLVVAKKLEARYAGT